MLVAFRCFLIHFSMGLWFLFLLPAITRTEKKKQQRSTIFRETAAETDRRPTQSLSPDEEACLLLLQSSPSYYFFMQRGKCHHKKGQPRCPMLYCSRCIAFPLSYSNKYKLHKGRGFCLLCSLLYLQGQGQCLDMDSSQLLTERTNATQIQICDI